MRSKGFVHPITIIIEKYEAIFVPDICPILINQ
jgi:hypothetical protein